MNRPASRHYPAEFKAQAVRLATSIGRAAAARQLDISRNTIKHWVRLANAGQPLSTPRRRAVTEHDSELSRLRAGNATVKMERDILKKATAFFARESR